MQPLGTWERRLLAWSGQAAVGAVLLTALVTWRWAAFDHATGSWFVIAHDLLEGTLYRPLASELGYGGTRYAPLYPVLLAALHLTGLGYVNAALLVNVAAAAAIGFGAWRILRLIGIDPFLSRVFAALSVSSFGALITLSSLRGDLLPVACAVWGVVFAAAARKGDHAGRDTVLAALFFALAVAAKLTAGFWFLGVAAWYVGTAPRKATLRFLVTCGVTFLLVGGVVHVASGGRFLEMLRVTGGGGEGLGYLAVGPLVFERFLRGSDPLGYLAVLAAIALLVTRPRGLRVGLPAWLFVAVVLMSIVVFGSYGTIQNHLVDVTVAAMLVIAPCWDLLRTKSNFVPLLMLVYTVWMGLVYATEYHEFSDSLERKQAIAFLSTRPGKVLSEHPAVPILAGRHPVLADAFMLRVVRKAVPEIDERFLAEVEAGEYTTILLTHDQYGWFEKVHFGPAFLGLIETHYEEIESFGDYRFYAPLTADAVGEPDGD